jgi:hypothetical protein
LCTPKSVLGRRINEKEYNTAAKFLLKRRHLPVCFRSPSQPSSHLSCITRNRLLQLPTNSNSIIFLGRTALIPPNRRRPATPHRHLSPLLGSAVLLVPRWALNLWPATPNSNPNHSRLQLQLQLRNILPHPPPAELTRACSSWMNCLSTPALPRSLATGSSDEQKHLGTTLCQKP